SLCPIVLLVLCALPLAAQTQSQSEDQPDVQNDDQTERILSFDSFITVHEDGSMLVKETIKVRSTGEQMKHGIYRDFPTEYVSRFLRLRDSSPFEIVSVRTDGSRAPYHTDHRPPGPPPHPPRAAY